MNWWMMNAWAVMDGDELSWWTNFVVFEQRHLMNGSWWWCCMVMADIVCVADNDYRDEQF